MATSTSFASSQTRARRRSTPLLSSLATFDSPRKWSGASPTSVYAPTPSLPSPLAANEHYASTSMQPTPTLPYRKPKSANNPFFSNRPTVSVQPSTPTIEETPIAQGPTIRIIAPQPHEGLDEALYDLDDVFSATCRPASRNSMKEEKPLPSPPDTDADSAPGLLETPVIRRKSTFKDYKTFPTKMTTTKSSSTAYTLPVYEAKGRKETRSLPSYRTSSTVDTRASSGLDSITSMQSSAALLAGKEDRNAIALRRALERIGVVTREVKGDETPRMASGSMEVPRRERWTTAKKVLLFSVLLIFVYATVGLAYSIVTWMRVWPAAEIFIILDKDVLMYLTLASVACLITSLIGLVGTLLNSRRILTIYCILIWPCFIAILMIGYTSYRRQALSLDRKLNQAWSETLSDLDRLRIQNNLHCCGYYSSMHDATYSKRCFPRTMLPGCKGRLYRFERDILHICFTSAFAVAPIHLFVLFVSVLCSNHVDRTFGKGILPAGYHLDMADVRQHALHMLEKVPPPEQEKRDFKLEPSFYNDHTMSRTMSRTSSSRSSVQSFDSMPSDHTLSGLGLMVQPDRLTVHH